jgi:hypothetical protein
MSKHTRAVSSPVDPLEFWADLAEVLGHDRGEVNPASLVTEVSNRLVARSPVDAEQQVREIALKAALEVWDRVYHFDLSWREKPTRHEIQDIIYKYITTALQSPVAARAEIGVSAAIDLLDRWLKDDPSVDNDPSLDRLLHTINENSLSDRDIPTPSVAATQVAREDIVVEARELLATGAVQLPLRVEGWHKSLTDGGHYIRQATGRILATVEFVPVETETGRPALDGNAPARAVVALLNAVPALCATVRELEARIAESDAHSKVLRDRLVVADGVYTPEGEYTVLARNAINRATVELREQLAAAEQERDRLRDWQCIACGAILSADMVDSLSGHSRTDADERGEPVAVHCGPCEPVEAITFRTRAINLCREKAAEWLARLPNSDDETFKYHYQTRADAATELATQLETLK